MNLKTFSQQSRRILIKGVAQKLLYWGFDAKGNVLEQPMPLEGGYLFRGEGYDDPTVPQKWSALREAVQKKGIETVVEEAAYTWFNRIMAIRILSKNKYDQSQLEFEGDSNTPTILVKARRGQVDFLNSQEKLRLQKVITNYSKEKESFAILLTGYCGQHQLLKSIFGRLDDYTELLLPDDILEKEGFIHLLNTTDAISEEDYQKVELIGWLYQFYISERKDEVFASFKKNKKAEAKDIPAATQIFTPNWIVKYMVQNTVGKLWLDLNPDSRLKDEMKYLIADDTQKQAPIISEIAGLKLLDPAVGSGHILVEGFDLLYAMYMEEFYTPEEAVESILKNNLFGLDIDNRAAQLAKFAVLLKAAKRYPEVLQKGWMPQVYAMPEPYTFSRQEVLDFLGKDGLIYEQELSDALKVMQDAQNLGSAMVIKLSEETRDYIIKRLKELQNQSFQGFEMQALLNKIASYLNVLGILTNSYESVAANPPYMGSGNMNGELKNFLNDNYPESKSDLFAVFIERMIDFLRPEARLGCITMESWMFLSSYEKLRNKIINNHSIVGLAHFGWHIIGIAFGTATLILEKSKRIKTGEYSYLTIDDIDRKQNVPIVFPVKNNGRFSKIPQTNFSKIPGSPIAYWVSERVVDLYSNSPLIESALDTRIGLVTGDNEYYIKNWYEVNLKQIFFDCTSQTDSENSEKKWYPQIKGGDYRKWFGNYLTVINWSKNGFELKTKMHKDGKRTLAHNFNDEYQLVFEGLTWTKISSGGFSVRLQEKGFVFNDASASAFPKGLDIDLYATISFLNSKIAVFIVKINNPTLNILPGNISKIPFRDINSSFVSSISKKNIAISKNDWNSRETSWGFGQSPILNECPDLKLSYQLWQHQVSENFFTLHQNEEELNRIFIDIYGLQEELDPEVSLTEITVLQEELDFKKLEKQETGLREKGIGIKAKDESLPLVPKGYKLPIKKDVVMKQLISYAIGVNMGRYRLDKPGLNIAHPDPLAEELAPYIHNGFTVEIDDDGIIPLMGTACTFADDAFQRVRYFLEVVWGSEALTQNLNFLQECLDEDLESYLVKKFWADHCKVYKKKPIYWLFSSEKGAFQVLTYMHRMNAFTVEKIRSNYLMPHLQHLRSQIDRLESSREDPRLLDKLHKNLSECETYDLKLKDVADRQIVFDLDDGVTRNYALFEEVVRDVK